MDKKEMGSLYREGRLGELNTQIGDDFLSYFSGKSYVVHSPAHLIAQEDETVTFIGSSISALKPQIISGRYGDSEGFAITQECLRNHALDYAFDNDWLPFGQAYFNMSTILSRPHRFQKVLEEASEYLIGSLEIDPSQIMIKSTKNLEELSDIHKHSPFKVDYDHEREEFYMWTYGLENIRGEGATVSILNPSTGSYFDVGAIVRILDNQNVERGTEFGYGHEFFASAILGIPNPLKLSQIFEIFPFEEDLSSKYYGYLEVVARIKKAKEKKDINVRRTVRWLHNKYLKSVKYMAMGLEKDDQTILSELSTFCEHISSSTDFTLEEKVLEKFDPKTKI